MYNTHISDMVRILIINLAFGLILFHTKKSKSMEEYICYYKSHTNITLYSSSKSFRTRSNLSLSIHLHAGKILQYSVHSKYVINIDIGDYSVKIAIFTQNNFLMPMSF